jgi:hypothetical protein
LLRTNRSTRWSEDSESYWPRISTAQDRTQTKHTLLLGGLALSVVLVGKLYELTNTTLQSDTLVIPLVKDILDILDLSRQPDSLDGTFRVGLNIGDHGALGDIAGSRGGLASETRYSLAKLLEGRARVVLVGNVGHGDSSSSSKGKVLGGRKPLLSDGDIVVVLSPQEVEGPVDENDCDKEVGNVSFLVVEGDISEAELVETAESGIGRCGTESQN